MEQGGRRSPTDAVTAITEPDRKPPILWIPATRMRSGATPHSSTQHARLGAGDPGWPGAGAAPPQPMVSQRREVLERYQADGGAVREVLFDGYGHSPRLERPVAEFRGRWSL